MAGIYTTDQGDMWDSISYKVYQTERFADALILANPQYVPVAVFEAGVDIICPDIPVEDASPAPPWITGAT
jgi:phage tail protein X